MSCGRLVREELLIMCDGCANTCHTFCCNPVLAAVPEDEWFCAECTASSMSGHTSTAESSGASPSKKKQVTYAPRAVHYAYVRNNSC